MPNPVEILFDPVSLVFLAMYGLLFAWEALAPGRALPRIPGWRARTLVSFAAYFYAASYLPLWWDPYLAPYQLWDASALGTAGGAVVGMLALQLVTYAWHRSLHAFTPLWRGFHQMHHSSERLDAASAFYFGPADIVGWAGVGSVALVLGVGIVPQAATIVVLATAWIAMFQHTNVRTPRWLGYLIQRPESHTLHHGRGFHAKNYADLPIVDMLFGTFENPAGYTVETGFYDGASARVLDMVLGRDVSSPSAETARPAGEIAAHA